MMFRTAAVVLAVVSFAAAFDKSMNQNWETVPAHEYIKAYYKLVDEGHERVKDVVSEVVPEHIKIRLYSSPEDVFEETLKNSFNLLHHPQFNHTLETKIYVHGWLEDEDTKLHKVLPTLYAFRGQKVNWITVDWSEYSLAKDIDFVQKQVVPKIAEYLVPLVEKLMETQNNNKVHFIGFGIGAHISGLASKRIHGRKVARITGLSPAGAVYNTVAEGERLAKGDAEYVDIIHTSMGTAGIAKPIGDVDFFPNGGRQQPAVENRADFTHVEKVIVSHMLAKNYFVESVELGCGGFIGKKCGSWSQFLSQECATHESEIMGEAVSQTVNGTVYLNVNAAMKPFYSLGIYGMYPYQHRQTYSAVPKIHV